MTFLGMGNLEVVIVLLVAFIFLGPERMVDAARLMGKAVREVRRMASELPSLEFDESLLDPQEAPADQRDGDRDRRLADGSRSSSKSDPVGDDKASDETASPPGTPETDERSAHENGPVAFRPSARGTTSSTSSTSSDSDEHPQDRT